MVFSAQCFQHSVQHIAVGTCRSMNTNVPRERFLRRMDQICADYHTISAGPLKICCSYRDQYLVGDRTPCASVFLILFDFPDSPRDAANQAAGVVVGEESLSQLGLEASLPPWQEFTGCWCVRGSSLLSRRHR